MEYQQTFVGVTEKCKWTIKNFSKFISNVYSDIFIIGRYPWKLCICPNGNNKDDYLSIYLYLVADENTTKLPKGWTADANFKLTVYNQVCSDKSVTLEVQVLGSAYEVTSTATASVGELADFRGIGQIKKPYILLLDEVCSHHPSLIECQQKRSPKFNEWAFTALGRVLHFLNTKKAKDMNEDACKDLQSLWEELETFRFDLTWLEPRVKFALEMKSYFEGVIQLEKLKDNVKALELKLKRMNEKVVAIKADLDIARSVLLKAKESFEERDLNAELGYHMVDHELDILLRDTFKF